MAPAPPTRRFGTDIGRLISALILFGLGAAVARVVLDGSFASYVRPVMRVPLGLAAIVLLAAGVVGAASAVQRAGDRPTPVQAPHGHSHAHHRIPRAALIALVPLAVLAVLRPPALDAGATDSVAPAASPQQQDGGIQVEPLPGDPDTPAAISFDELSTRANASNGPATLQNRTLKLEGFVAKSKAGAPAGTVRVGRYMIWCCAADAAFGVAFVRWPAGAPAPGAGAWFTLVGRVQSIVTVDGAAVPVLQASQVRAEPRPSQPYEY